MKTFTGTIYATERLDGEGTTSNEAASRKIMTMVFNGDLPQEVLGETELLSLLEKVPQQALLRYSTSPKAGVAVEGYKCPIIFESPSEGWGLCMFIPNCSITDMDNPQILYPDLECCNLF